MRYSAADFVERIKELKEDVVNSIQEEGLSQFAVSSIIVSLQCAEMEIKIAKAKEEE